MIMIAYIQKRKTGKNHKAKVANVKVIKSKKTFMYHKAHNGKKKKKVILNLPFSVQHISVKCTDYCYTLDYHRKSTVTVPCN